MTTSAQRKSDNLARSAVPAVIALVALAACTEQSGGFGASVARDDHGFTAVWGAPGTSRNQIAVTTLQTRRGDARPQPTEVAQVGALAAVPELAWDGARFLLVLHHGSGAVTAQQVAPDGSASAAARPLARFALALCTPPVWLGTSYGVAWAAPTESGQIEYLLARVSQDGALLDVTTIDRGPSRAPGCALQASEHTFALSYVLDHPDHADPDHPDDDSDAHLLFARIDASGKVTLRRQLATTGSPVQPLRLRALGPGYALLYRARGPAPLQLVRLSATGRQLGTLALPSDIRPDTVDLVAGQGRFAAAWSEPGRVHLVKLDGAGTVIDRDELARPGQLSRVRMDARGDACALTWTEFEDRAVMVAGSSTCLAADGGFSPLRGRVALSPLRAQDALSPLRGRVDNAAPSPWDP